MSDLRKVSINGIHSEVLRGSGSHRPRLDENPCRPRENIHVRNSAASQAIIALINIFSQSQNDIRSKGSAQFLVASICSSLILCHLLSGLARALTVR